ncbi:MAG: hypothetical protein IID41_18125 [Planctomycetes bacterium]|nr:hypothetical protein [Planctomycetota bacterium]
MTSQEALNLLDQAAAEANTNRKNHDLIQYAVTLLRVAIAPPDGKNKANEPANET